MKLHELRDNEGAAKKQKRVARGPGSGKGKTAGRGHKGQKSRSGVAIGGYEGGQMPLYRRLPKRGFNKPNQVEYNEVNLDQLEGFQAGSVVTKEVLRDAKMLHKPGNPVAILGRGDVKVALTVQVQRVTKSAREKIEAAGGKVEIVA